MKHPLTAIRSSLVDDEPCEPGDRGFERASQPGDTVAFAPIPEHDEVPAAKGEGRRSFTDEDGTPSPRFSGPRRAVRSRAVPCFRVTLARGALAGRVVRTAQSGGCRVGGCRAGGRDVTAGPANRIREIRCERGLTQSRLAELVNATTQQISYLERGERQLTLHWMTRLAAALGCAPADLFSPAAPSPDPRRRGAALARPAPRPLAGGARRPPDDRAVDDRRRSGLGRRRPRSTHR